MREAWTDERLDDLKDSMHREFDQVHAEIGDFRTHTDGEFRSLRTHMDGEFKSLRLHTAGKFSSVRGEISSMREHFDQRFDSLNRTLIGGAFSIVVAVVGAVLAHAL